MGGPNQIIRESEEAIMFDAMTYLDRKCRGEQWHLLAREAGMSMSQLRARLEAIGRDRLAAAGYRVQEASPSSRPSRLPKHPRCRPASVTKAPTPANGISKDSELNHDLIPVSQEPDPPAILAFDRTGEDSRKLTDKYRPRTLSEVLGQLEIVASLQRFVTAPYSCAMLFTGDSGIGKTSAAYALAYDLGCAIEQAELGGVFEIPSGSQTAESVRKILDAVRYSPLCGSGWRVLMVNECDRMALPVETIWLDALEHLPAMTVVIFTTNEPARLSQRFRNRCEEYAFLGGSDRLKPWITALARKLWDREGKGPPPDLDGIGLPTLGDVASMTASFRLAVQQLQQMFRSLASHPNRG
jgi:hypothetical protein